MPNTLMLADSSFPRFTDEEGTRERIDRVYDYLYQLLEQLRYTLANLGGENFNSTALVEIEDEIAAPLEEELNIFRRAMIGEDGSMSDFIQTGVSLYSRISELSGSVTEISQTVNGITLSATNGFSSSTIKLLSNGILIDSATIAFEGVVTFSDLEGEGRTTINGANIKTGTIESVGISACTIVGGEMIAADITSATISGGTINGATLNLYYEASEYEDTALKFIWGSLTIGELSMFYDDENSKCGILLKSTAAAVMKLEAGYNMSLVASGLMHIEADDYIALHGPVVYIYNPLFYSGNAWWRINSSGALEQTAV